MREKNESEESIWTKGWYSPESDFPEMRIELDRMDEEYWNKNIFARFVVRVKIKLGFF